MADASEDWLKKQQIRGNAHTMGEDTQALGTITTAVRSAMNAASDADKEKKHGQQKWGLFETNYQRNKGISTEESLQEIERFANATGNEVPQVAKQATSTTTTIGADGRPVTHSTTTTTNSAGQKVTTVTTTTTTAQGLPPGKFGSGGGGATGLPTNKFKPTPGTVDIRPGTDAGSAFFQQSQAREAAKYKPRGDFTKGN